MIDKVDGARMKRFAGAVLAAILCSSSPVFAQVQQLGPAPSSATSPLITQKAINYIAAVPFPTSAASAGAPYIPKGQFSSWSAEDRKATPMLLTRACQVMWILFHDDPATWFLPPAQAEKDEEELGTDLCVAGHMPDDWPGRNKALGRAKAILSRAKSLGSALELPPTLTR